MPPSPRLGQPDQSTPCEQVVSPTALGELVTTPGPALPMVKDPPAAPVGADPSAETLERLVDNEQLLILDAYLAAGWRHAIEGAWVRTTVADRLRCLSAELPERWGLAVFDAWRPIELQQELFEAMQHDPDAPDGLIGEPSSDPTTPPPHATGGAVDLTFTYDRVPLGLGTGFDDMTDRAPLRAFETKPGLVQQLRRELWRRMTAEGFVVYPDEWWHWEWGTRRWAAIRGAPAVYGAIVP